MIPRLRVLPSGPPSSAGEPVEQLQSDLMLEVLARCTEAADVVVIDSAPVLPVADSLVLAPVVDGVLFVADAHKATRDAIVQCRYQLSQVGGRIIGGVLDGHRSPIEQDPLVREPQGFPPAVPPNPEGDLGGGWSTRTERVEAYAPVDSHPRWDEDNHPVANGERGRLETRVDL